KRALRTQHRHRTAVDCGHKVRSKDAMANRPLMWVVRKEEYSEPKEESMMKIVFVPWTMCVAAGLLVLIPLTAMGADEPVGAQRGGTTVGGRSGGGVARWWTVCCRWSGAATPSSAVVWSSTKRRTV